MRRFIYPKFPFRALPGMLGWAAAGAVVAGVFGIVHDQVTYTVGPDYFTHFKFHQFADANPGGHPRLFVAVIGFLATWWVGLIAGWILARCGLSSEGRLPPARAMIHAFLVMLVVTTVFSVGGFLFGVQRTIDGAPAVWLNWLEALPLDDPVAFARVGYIHNASYLGGLVGLIVSAVMMRKGRRLWSAVA